MTTPNPTDSGVPERLEPCPWCPAVPEPHFARSSNREYMIIRHTPECFRSPQLGGYELIPRSKLNKWNTRRASVAAPQGDAGELRLYDRADGVKDHFCVGRKVTGCGFDYNEFWNKDKFSSAGEVFIGRDAAEAKLREIAATQAGEVSTAPVVDHRRVLYSELIHIAAELVRGDGFLSTCAEDLNPQLKRADILKTAERQEVKLKDWAYRVRRVADKLSVAAAPLAAPVRITEAIYVSEHPVDLQCNQCGLKQTKSFKCPVCEGQLVIRSASPSDAARRAAEEIAANYEVHKDRCHSNERYPSPPCDCGAIEEIAAMMSKHFAATPADNDAEGG